MNVPSWTPPKPWATRALVAVCVVVWIAEMRWPHLLQQLALIPAVTLSEPWRLVTSAFAHSLGFFHLPFNMYALWILGGSLEPFLGRLRFLLVYLVSALGGGLAVLVHALVVGGIAAITPTVGASGAVFGLFGVLLVMNRLVGRSSRGLWVILAINAVLGFTIPNVSWQAHLGGFLLGLAGAAIMAWAARRRASGTQVSEWPVLGALTALLMGALVAVSLALGA